VAALKREKAEQREAILKEAGLLKEDNNHNESKIDADNDVLEESKEDTEKKRKETKISKVKPGMTKTAKRNALAIPNLSRQEIERIIDTPWHALERKEVLIRKLLNKFHDRSEVDGTGSGSVLSLDNDAVPYDPKLAVTARAKPRKDLTDQERQWICIDEVMNPEMHDKQSKVAMSFDFSKGDHQTRKMKALERKEHERRLMESLDAGVLAAMPGTIANSTGWYQDGASKQIVFCTISEGEWSVAIGPMSEDELLRLKRSAQMWKEDEDGVACPGTEQGEEGFYMDSNCQVEYKTKEERLGISEVGTKSFGKAADEDDSETQGERLQRVLKKMRRQLRGGGVVKLAREFRKIDKDCTGDLNKDELNLTFMACGLQISASELTLLWEHFDADKSGTVDFEEFVQAVKAEASATAEFSNDLLYKCPYTKEELEDIHAAVRKVASKAGKEDEGTDDKPRKAARRKVSRRAERKRKQSKAGAATKTMLTDGSPEKGEEGDDDESATEWVRKSDGTPLDLNERRIQILMLRFYGQPRLVKGPYKAVKFRHIQQDKKEKPQTTDIDERCRQVLRELDRAVGNSNPFMDSHVLHNSAQRYPTAVLRIDLERELDSLLLSQMYEREVVKRMGALENDESDDSDLSEDDEEAILARENRRKQRAHERAQQRNPHHKRKMLEIAMKKKTALEKALEDKEKEGLPPYEPYVNVEDLKQRLVELHDEVEYIRQSSDKICTSVVCSSYKKGGSGIMKREDLIHELNYEMKVINQQLKLEEVDRELHMCFDWKGEYFETQALHGYKQTQFTSNVKIALNEYHDRLVATEVTREIIDDILDWMLEGWMFGERESSLQIAGYVPSVKKEGVIKPYDVRRLEFEERQHEKDNKLAKLRKIEKEKEQLEDQRTPNQKWTPIEMDAQEKLGNELVVKKGSELDHQLNETETAIKFGMFLTVYMYFRAQALLRRDRDMLSGKNDAVTSIGEAKLCRKVTTERARMIEEKKKADDRLRLLEAASLKAKEGSDRKRVREEREREDARQKLYAVMRLRKKEKEGAVEIQKMYRAHLGRKAAAKWALKKAEIDALAALKLASAVTMQRTYRGRLGRLRAEEKRVEMAEFIAAIRAEEALEEESDYWRTHPFARWKRNARNFFRRGRHKEDLGAGIK